MCVWGGGVQVSHADSGPINPHSMMSTLHMTYGAHRGGQLRQPLVNMWHGRLDAAVNFHISLVIGPEVLSSTFCRILLRAALYLPPLLLRREGTHPSAYLSILCRRCWIITAL